MKLRQGHVSNSSSSSFMIILEEEDYKKMISSLGDLPRKIAEISSWRSFKKPGLVMVSIWSGMGGEDQLDALGFKEELLGRHDEEPEDDEEYEALDKAHARLFEANKQLEHALRRVSGKAIHCDETGE